MTPNEAARASHARTCDGKFKCHSRRDARRIARRTPDGHNLIPYLCGHCGFWHNGHTAKTRKAKP